MVNPWSQLPTDAPHVLRQDLPIVEKFNKHYAHNPDIKIQSHLLPEPFIGDPSARVYLLNLNPGYSPEDDDWHRKPVYRTAIIENLGHKTTAYPFYFLDPSLEAAPGAAWWRRRSRWWIRDVGTETLARNLFCAELFPYHSSRLPTGAQAHVTRRAGTVVRVCRPPRPRSDSGPSTDRRHAGAPWLV